MDVFSLVPTQLILTLKEFVFVNSTASFTGLQIQVFLPSALLDMFWGWGSVTCGTHQTHLAVYQSLPTPHSHYSCLMPQLKGFGEELVLFAKWFLESLLVKSFWGTLGAGIKTHLWVYSSIWLPKIQLPQRRITSISNNCHLCIHQRRKWFPTPSTVPTSALLLSILSNIKIHLSMGFQHVYYILGCPCRQSDLTVKSLLLEIPVWALPG